MPKKEITSQHNARLTPTSDHRPHQLEIDDSLRLREIRKLVRENNKSLIDEEYIICQIYMESRFDPHAHAQGSSARGLMQLLKAPVRELARLENLKLPRNVRRPESQLYQEADAFHDSARFVDEVVNIQTGTAYMQALIDKRTAEGVLDPVAEAYKDYRGIRNGIYFKKIKAAGEKLKHQPDSMQILRDMVK